MGKNKKNTNFQNFQNITDIFGNFKDSFMTHVENKKKSDFQRNLLITQSIKTKPLPN